MEEVLASMADMADMGTRTHDALADADLKFGKIKDERATKLS